MRINLKRRYLLLLLALVGAIAVWRPVQDLYRAARFLASVRELASGATGESLPVATSRVQRNMGGREVEAVVYRPAGRRPGGALMLVAGVSELGCYHPRLVALSRTLADEGFAVVTPDIRSFRQFEVAEEGLQEIEFWSGQMSGLEAAGMPKRHGIIGISFSGTLAVKAASRPELRNAISFVLSIGGYQDLERCARGWFAEGPQTVGAGYYPTRYYGRWIVMLAAIDLLESEPDRGLLRKALLELLLKGTAQQPADAFGGEARRWYQLAVMSETQSDPELVGRIQGHLAPLYARLSPNEAAPGVRCPVFLAHGAYDDLIPPGESRELQRLLSRSEATLLVSPFLTHTHPLERPLGRFERLTAAGRMFAFFYRLAGAAR